MTSQITVGSPAYKSILARVNYLERKQASELLPWAERKELERERAKLVDAELEHDKAMAGAHE